MLSFVTVIIALIALVIGGLIARLVSQKEISSLNAKRNSLSTELDSIRSALSSRVGDFNTVLNDKSSEHASELASMRDTHRLAVDSLESEWRDKLRAAEEKAFADGFRQAELRNEKREMGFSVQVRPYIQKIKGTSWLFQESHRSAVGFQYQLYVNGIPCFQPHVLIDQEFVEETINDARLQWLTEQALKVAQLAVQATGAQGFINVMDVPVIADK